MRYLKTNTATRITVGPFIDKTDGITPEVALTATNEHLTLIVDTGGVPTLVLDADATTSGGDNDMVHVTNDDAGFYDLELTAAQLNYVGRAILSINYVTDHCPVFHEFTILPAQVYDSLILGTDLLDANASQLGGTSQTGGDVGASVATIETAVSASSIRTAVGLATANLDTQLADIPTVAEFDARSTADPATATAVAAIPTDPLLAVNYTAPDNAGITAIGSAITALNDLSAADVNAEVVDVLRTDTIPDSYAADGAQPTLAQAILAIQQMMQEKSISTTTLTVKKPDGITTAMTFTLDDASAPTSITRAS